MLGKEDLIVLMNLSQLMAAKMEEPILHMCGWINGHIIITVARLYSHMICGAHLTSTLWYREPDYESVSGLGLTQ